MKKKLLSTLAAVSMLTNLVTPVMAAPISHNETNHYSYATGYEGNVTEAEFLESSYTIQNSKSKNLLDELMAYVDDSLLAHELRHVEWYLENHDSNYPFTLDASESGKIWAGFDSGTATLKAVITRTDGKVVTASTTLVAAPRTISYATGFSMDNSLTLRTGSEAIFDEVITIKPTGETGAIFSADQAQAIIDAVNDTEGLDVYLRQGYNITTSDADAYYVAPTASVGSSVNWNGYSGYEDIEVTYQVGNVNQATGEFTKGYLNLDVTNFVTAESDSLSVKDGNWVYTGNEKQFYVGGTAITATVQSGSWSTYDLLSDIVRCMNAENRYSASLKESQYNVLDDGLGTSGKVLQIVMNTDAAESYEEIVKNLTSSQSDWTAAAATSYQDYTLSGIDAFVSLSKDGYDNYTIGGHATYGTQETTEATDGGDGRQITVDDTDSTLIGVLNIIINNGDTSDSVRYVLWDNKNNKAAATTVLGDQTHDFDWDNIVLRAYSTDSAKDTANSAYEELQSLTSFNNLTLKLTETENDTVSNRETATITLKTSSSKVSWAGASNWYLSGSATDGTGTAGNDLINYDKVTASTAYDYTLSVDDFPRYSKNVKTDVIDDVARSIRIDSVKAIQPTGLYQTSSITVAVGAMVDLENHFKVNSTTNSHHDVVYNEAYFNNDASYTYNDYGVITVDDEILGVREGKNKVVASVYNSATNSTYYAEVTVTVVPRTGTSTTVTPTLYPLTLTSSASTITLGGAGTSLAVSNYGENNISDSIFPTLQSTTNFKIEDHVEFVSNDPTVLSVNEDGVVTAVGVGTGSITVKVPNSDYEATTTISVIAPTIPQTDGTTGGTSGGSTSVPATAVNVLGQLF